MPQSYANVPFLSTQIKEQVPHVLNDDGDDQVLVVVLGALPGAS